MGLKRGLAYLAIIGAAGAGGRELYRQAQPVSRYEADIAAAKRTALKDLDRIDGFGSDGRYSLEELEWMRGSFAKVVNLTNFIPEARGSKSAVTWLYEKHVNYDTRLRHHDVNERLDEEIRALRGTAPVRRAEDLNIISRYRRLTPQEEGERREILNGTTVDLKRTLLDEVVSAFSENVRRTYQNKEENSRMVAAVDDEIRSDGGLDILAGGFSGAFAAILTIFWLHQWLDARRRPRVRACSDDL